MIFRGPLRPFILLVILALCIFVLLTPWGLEAGQKTKKVILDATVNKGEQDGITEWEFRRALTYQGTGSRIQAFLRKARSGKPFTVAVIGGSGPVSKGRGLTPPPTDQYAQPHRSEEDGVESEGEGEESLLLDPLRFLRPGMGASTLYSTENMHVRIFDWLNATFPHAENRFVNGAQGGVGSGYFGWCFNEHIPESSDLILLELGINDLVGVDVMRSYEILMRGLLELPSRPAIIGIETFSTLFETLAQASSVHHDVNAFYDIPSISVREAILPKVLDTPEIEMPKWFRTGDDVTFDDESKVREWGGMAVDVMHISALGHELAANLVIRYMAEEMRQSSALSWHPSTWGRPSLASHLAAHDLPSVTLTGTHDLHHHVRPRHDPTCRSMNSPILHPSPDGSILQGLTLASGSHGWKTWSWSEKRYLVAKDPGALAIFAFTIPDPEDEEAKNDVSDAENADAHKSGQDGYAEGFEIIELDTRALSSATPMTESASVLISYQRSAKFGLGSIICWVDDARDNGKVIDGYWKEKERNMGMVALVAADLSPGEHRLSCELLEQTADPGGGHEFRFIAVMHGQ